MRSCFAAVFTYRDVAPIEITHNIFGFPFTTTAAMFCTDSLLPFVYSQLEKKEDGIFLQQDGGKRPL